MVGATFFLDKSEAVTHKWWYGLQAVGRRGVYAPFKCFSAINGALPDGLKAIPHYMTLISPTNCQKRLNFCRYNRKHSKRTHRILL